MSKNFDETEERSRKRRADALTAPVEEVSPLVSQNAEKVSSVVESRATARYVGEVSDVAPAKEDNGKGHTVDSRSYGNIHFEIVKEKKSICREEPILVDAPTDGDVGVVGGDAMAEGTLIANERGGVGCDTEVPVYKRPHSFASDWGYRSR